jgi:tetratricopeptide (TPR) repeat protein
LLRRYVWGVLVMCGLGWSALGCRSEHSNRWTRLPAAEVEARLGRPIEASVYDPKLTKWQKRDLLFRYYHLQGLPNKPVDEMMHAVMSEGMTDLEAAEYWVGRSNRWAVHHAEEALRSDPESMEALRLWVTRLSRARAAEAQAAYLAMLERDPDYYTALSSLMSATQRHRPEEALEYARWIVHIMPWSSVGYLHLGQAYERLGEPEAAALAYRDGLEVASESGHRAGWLRGLRNRISTSVLANGGEACFASLSGPLQASLDALENGTSTIIPVRRAQPGSGPRAEGLVRAGPTAQESMVQRGEPSRGSATDGAARPDWTPDIVRPHLEATRAFRALVSEYRRVSGKTYESIHDFPPYARKTNNWMAWRYKALAEQYREADQPDEAERVMDAARHWFPDDRLLRERRSWLVM